MAKMKINVDALKWYGQMAETTGYPMNGIFHQAIADYLESPDTAAPDLGFATAGFILAVPEPLMTQIHALQAARDLAAPDDILTAAAARFHRIYAARPADDLDAHLARHLPRPAARAAGDLAAFHARARTAPRLKR
jgi:hypothetical protein